MTGLLIYLVISGLVLRLPYIIDYIVMYYKYVIGWDVKDKIDYIIIHIGYVIFMELVLTIQLYISCKKNNGKK